MPPAIQFRMYTVFPVAEYLKTNLEVHKAVLLLRAQEYEMRSLARREEGVLRMFQKKVTRKIWR